jgi:hypothetical protein
MDPPKTRRETKKTAKEKKGSVYSAKHVRKLEARAASVSGAAGVGSVGPRK